MVSEPEPAVTKPRSCPHCCSERIERYNQGWRCAQCGKIAAWPHKPQLAPGTPRAGSANDPRLELSIADCGLPVRTVEYLERKGIIYLRQLLAVPRRQFDTWGGDGFGPFTRREIFRMLGKLGFPVRRDDCFSSSKPKAPGRPRRIQSADVRRAA